MMRRFALWAAVVALGTGCGPTASDLDPHVPAAPESGTTLYASLPQGATPVAASALPSFRYPEDLRLSEIREVRFSDDPDVEAVREGLQSDGDGRFRLDITEIQPKGGSAWVAAPSLSVLTYEQRGRYLVRYRDPHLGHPTGFSSNYDWYLDPIEHDVAGRHCRLWLARSRFGFGGADYFVDVETDLVLGWVLYASGLREQMRSTVLSLDFDPELDGVAWQEPQIPSQPYDPDVHDDLLGFRPSAPEYLPPGFYLAEQTVLLIGPVTGVEGDLHVALYHDGVQLMFATQRADSSTNHADEAIDHVMESRSGGVGVVEGASDGIWISVVGGLPDDELQTVFGSMID